MHLGKPRSLEMIYQLKNGVTPWGDYGSILIHGMAARRDAAKRIPLERTGPWIPPLSYPFSCLIVTSAFRRELEQSRMKGLRFRPVTKSRIVKLDWHKWDCSTDEPKRYPRGGEPENYILSRKHSPAMAKALGDLWEIRVAAGVRESRVRVKGRDITDDRIVVHESTWTGADIFGGTETLYVYVSGRMRSWLELRVGPSVIAFKPVEFATSRQEHRAREAGTRLRRPSPSWA